MFQAQKLRLRKGSKNDAKTVRNSGGTLGYEQLDFNA